MQNLLVLDPNYQPSEVDLVEFKNLHQSYKVVSRFAYGIMGGVLQPDYRIIKHQSYSGNTKEPEDYEEHTGFLIGVTGEVALIYGFFLNTAILYERRGFSQQD